MKRAIIILAALVSGCAIVPMGIAHNACELIEITTRETMMSPGWYISAGQVLEACGEPDAIKRAEYSACRAEAWNGYRPKEECEQP